MQFYSHVIHKYTQAFYNPEQYELFREISIVSMKRKVLCYSHEKKVVFIFEDASNMHFALLNKSRQRAKVISSGYPRFSKKNYDGIISRASLTGVIIKWSYN